MGYRARVSPSPAKSAKNAKIVKKKHRETLQAVMPLRPEPPGSRGDAKQQTRAALVEAATRVFRDHGLDASLDEICAAAGYTRGAFYVHFKDREDLIAAVVGENNQRRVESLIASGDDDLDLERTILMFAEAVRSGVYPGVGAVQLHQFLAAVERSEPVRLEEQRVLAEAKAKLARAAERGQQAGTVRPDVEAGAVADLLLCVVSGIDMRLAAGAPADVLGLARALLKMLEP